MAGIFISYRRADNAAGYSRSMAQVLRNTFGRDEVFRDVRSIPPGQDFASYIRYELDTCKVMLVLIGTHWTSITDSRGNRRLFNPDDWVRQEVSFALNKGIHVIPVLVCGAPIPSAEELPPELEKLSRLNAFEMTDADWEHDLERLVSELHDILGIPLPPLTSRTRQPLEQIIEFLRAIRRLPFTGRKKTEPTVARRLISFVGGSLKVVLIVGIFAFILLTQDKESAAWLHNSWDRSVELLGRITASFK